MPEPNESLMAALADFAAGAGHEINNPLAIISGHAQILLESVQSPEQRRRLAAIISQAKRAYEMIADLRTFACPPEPHKSFFDLRSFFEELIADYGSIDSEYPVSIHLKWDGHPGDIFCDRQMLRMVFDALLQNTSEAVGRKESQVELIPIFLPESESWQISITDDGPGIAPEESEHIFFPYYSGRNAGRGLGFGLPRCWSLLRKMGGSITLETTGFNIIIPSSAEKN